MWDSLDEITPLPDSENIIQVGTVDTKTSMEDESSSPAPHSTPITPASVCVTKFIFEGPVLFGYETNGTVTCPGEDLSRVQSVAPVTAIPYSFHIRQCNTHYILFNDPVLPSLPEANYLVRKFLDYSGTSDASANPAAELTDRTFGVRSMTVNPTGDVELFFSQPPHFREIACLLNGLEYNQPGTFQLHCHVNCYHGRGFIIEFKSMQLSIPELSYHIRTFRNKMKPS